MAKALRFAAALTVALIGLAAGLGVIALFVDVAYNIFYLRAEMLAVFCLMGIASGTAVAIAAHQVAVEIVDVR